jgi:hypothetical protein
MTLDNSCESRRISRLDLIKLDVDGNQNAMLAAFGRSLVRFKPRIILEFALYAHDPSVTDTFDEAVRLPARFSYDFFQVRNRSAMPSNASDLRSVIANGTSTNALLVPRRADLTVHNGMELPLWEIIE